VVNLGLACGAFKVKKPESDREEEAEKDGVHKILRQEALITHPPGVE
jgi:hypothetical protein